MDFDTIKNNFDIEEPILLDWAIDALLAFRKSDSELADTFEEAIFTDNCIRKIVEAEHTVNKSILIERLSSEKFNQQLPLLEERFENRTMAFSESVAFLKCLAFIDPKKTADFLETEYGRTELSKRASLNMIAGLLPDSDAEQFFNRLADDMLPQCNEALYEEAPGLFADVLKASIHIKHQDAVSKIADYLSYTLRDPEGDPLYMLYELIDLCDSGSFEFELFDMVFTGEVGIFPDTVENLFALPDGALTVSELFGKISRKEYSDISELTNRFLPKLSDAFTVELIETLTGNSELMMSLEDVELKEMFQGAVMSLILSHFSTGEFEKELSEPESVFLLGVDVAENPYIDAIITAFKNTEPAVAVEYLSRRLETEMTENVSRNIIRVMEALQTDAFIPAMFRFLEDYFERELDGVVDSCIGLLSSYGHPTITFMDEQFQTFDTYLYPFLIEIAGSINIPESELFLLKYFDVFMRNAKSELLDVLTRRLSQKAVEKLKHKTGKDQFPIDKLYVVTSLLNGKRDEEGVSALLDSVRKEHRRHLDLLTSFIATESLSEPRNEIGLELECEICGDISDYKVKKVYISGEEAKPYIADELTCIECGGTGEFHPTREGLMSITAENFRLLAMRNEDEYDDDYALPGVIEYIQTAFLGRPMGIHEGIEAYRKRIEKNPGDPDNYIGLGNVYRFLEKRVAARQNYEIAIKISPFHIESYFNMAQILDAEGKPDEAMEFLEQGKKYLSRPVISKSCELSPEEVLDGYVNHYNSLIDETESDKDYLPYQTFDEIPVKAKKIGRNEKCPCGSGKKYKKCCMMKQKRAGL